MSSHSAPPLVPSGSTTSSTRSSRSARRPSSVSLVCGVAVLAVTLTGCSALGTPGSRVTEQRDIEAVTAVELSTSGDLVIEAGDVPSLTVTAGENVIDSLTSDVVGGVLKLDHDNLGWGRLGRIEYHLVLPRTEEVAVEGSGDVSGDLGETTTVRITVAGSGDVHADGLDLESLEVEVDGSGQVTLGGSAASQDIRISGSGGFDGQDLPGQDADVLLAGSGDAEVNVAGSLQATVAGSGSVRHTGGAKVTSSVSGSGSISED